MPTGHSNETDITVYGATSFVARHVLRYLLEASNDVEQFRITLGGRNQSKLEALKSELARHKNGAVVQDIFVASGSDAQGLKKMSKRSRVVLNCAGPYSLYSNLVVNACAEVGTDYVDFTGEVAWSAEMRQKYGNLSKNSGARIVSFCGYDSIPSDLAVFAAVEALKEKSGGVRIESAKLWHQMFGLPNGGTVQTAVDLPIDPVKDFLKKDKEGFSLRKAPFFLGDPLSLAHPERVRHNPNYELVKNRLAMSEWLNQLLSVDINFCLGVSLPGPMSAVNLKVIHASSVALSYGEKFTARERFIPLGFFFTKLASIMAFFPMILIQFSILCIIAVAKFPVIGKKVVGFLAPAGSGSPDFLSELGGNAVYAMVTAEAKDNSGMVDRAYAYLSFKGDAANLVTAQCVSESALALVFDRSDLPARSEDGFGTPAEMLGNVLLTRFRAAKVRPVEVKTLVRTKTSKNEMKLYIV